MSISWTLPGLGESVDAGVAVAHDRGADRTPRSAMNDWTLLREYVDTGASAAFTELVARHVDLVWSVARRQVRDPHVAEDVTQAVFILLAKKARQLDEHVVLSAWLVRTARFV